MQQFCLQSADHAHTSRSPACTLYADACGGQLAGRPAAPSLCLQQKRGSRRPSLIPVFIMHVLHAGQSECTLLINHRSQSSTGLRLEYSRFTILESRHMWYLSVVVSDCRAAWAAHLITHYLERGHRAWIRSPAGCHCHLSIGSLSRRGTCPFGLATGSGSVQRPRLGIGQCHILALQITSCTTRCPSGKMMMESDDERIRDDALLQAEDLPVGRRWCARRLLPSYRERHGKCCLK